MQNTPRTNARNLALSLAVLLVAAGCTTETKKADAPAADGKQKDEYVLVTPTGSRIPVKVKKGQGTNTTANEKGSEELSKQQRMMNEAKYTPVGGGE